MDYVATWLICGSLPLLSPALKCWGPPGRQVLCSQPAHLWVILILSPVKGCRPSRWQAFCSHRVRFWPLLIFSPAIKDCGTLRWKGVVCGQPTQLGLTSDFVPRYEA